MSTQIVQAGAFNATGLIVPGAVIQISPPGTGTIQGATTSLLGLVGSATWGPVGVPTPVGSMDGLSQAFGPLQNRSYDLGTAAAIAIQQGANNLMCVRCTDGTDVAATANVVDGASAIGMVATAKYTGSMGNTASVTLGTGSAASTSRAIVAVANLTPETFDNISQGVVKNTVTPGTGFTSVPTLSYSAPQLAGGVQALGTVNLVVIGTPTVGAGGASNAIGDFITFSNGVVAKVATLSGNAVATFNIISTPGCNAGSITSGNTPTNPVAMVSSSGSGTGVTANFTWGLGTVTMTQPGTGYTSATVTVNGGGGSAGSIAVITAIWLNLVNAINSGITGVRGPSNIIVASQGAGTGAAVATSTLLAGGADGVGNITSSTLIGIDTVPRKGMYALRGTGCAVITLADLSDTTKFAAVVAYGLSEGAFMAVSTPVGDTITNAANELSAAGIDSYAIKVLFGDWVYWQDSVNAVTRLIAPATFWAGERAATAPQNSTLNSPTLAVVGTQKSVSGGIYTQADLQSLITARLDVIASPSNGGAYFSPASGNNSSSSGAINGENYTTMTNFLARSIGSWAGSVIGQLQNPTQRQGAKASLDNFFAGLASQNAIGNAQGTQPWQVILDQTNNPSGQVAAGYEVATVKVTYLSVIRFFIINLQGGQTVTVTVVQPQAAFPQAG